MEGYTASEMAKILGINLKTAKLRLFRYGIKPVTNESLYDKSALEAIRNVPGKGRPKNPVIENVETSCKILMDALEFDERAWETVEKGEEFKKTFVQLRETFKETFHKAIHTPSPENTKALEQLTSELNNSEIVKHIAGVINRLTETEPDLLVPGKGRPPKAKAEPEPVPEVKPKKGKR